jgi:hypothetical protein
MTTKAAVRRRGRVVFDKPRQRRLPQHAGKRAPTALSVRIVIFMVADMQTLACDWRVGQLEADELWSG